MKINVVRRKKIENKITFSSQLSHNGMKIRIYQDTCCDENLSKPRSKKSFLNKAVPKFYQTHFIFLRHIFMKK